MDREEAKEPNQDLGRDDFLHEVKEAIKESKDKSVFIADSDIAMGIKIAIDDKVKGSAKTIGVKDDKDVEIMENALL